MYPDYAALRERSIQNLSDFLNIEVDLGITFAGLASISTRNNSVNTIGVFHDPVTTQANWMISFLSPNQGIGVG